MNDLNKALQQNIRILRERLDLTQDEVANFLNVNRVVYNYFESGRREVPMLLVSKLADLFGVDESDLFEDNFDIQKVNSELTFRKDDLLPEDLVEVANFQKFVKSFIKMQELSNESR